MGEGDGDEGRDEESNEYDIVTIRANAVSFAPYHLSLFALLSPRFNAATNSSLTRPRNKLARKFELFRVGGGERRG